MTADRKENGSQTERRAMANVYRSRSNRATCGPAGAEATEAAAMREAVDRSEDRLNTERLSNTHWVAAKAGATGRTNESGWHPTAAKGKNHG